MEKIGNFNVGYIDSVLSVEGYHDLFNFSAAELAHQSSVVSRREIASRLNKNMRTYDFVFIPNSGFLNSNLPLMKNCELKLSFDRLNSELSLLKTGEVTNNCMGTPLAIKDCVAITEYITSEYLENYFMSIDTDPIPYYYQDCEIIVKNLPLEETSIRVDNIRGGNLPSYIFAAIIPSDNMIGSETVSSTCFKQHNVSAFNITLNGNSVNGYPIDVTSAVYPFQKFMDVTNRYMNPYCGEGLKLGHFLYNWIYSHKFEAESSPQGWIGMSIELKQPLLGPHNLVIWCVNECGITIDKFHQVEKINL